MVKLPPPEELPADYRRRVVVKFRPNVQLPYSAAAHTEITNVAPREWAELTAAHPGITLVPYFSTLEEHTLRQLAQPPAQSKLRPSSLSTSPSSVLLES